MAYIRTKLGAATRGTLVLSLVCLLSTLTLGVTPDGAAAASSYPVARSVRAVTSGGATLITISGTAPMAHAVRRPEEMLLVVDLPGVDASQLSQSYGVESPLVAGVTVHRALKGKEPLASLHVALRAPVRERSNLVGNDLMLELLPVEKRGGTSAGATLGGEQAGATPTPTPQNGQPVLSQGQQYGTPGFVGEPINLNVVNADIRDILNYITEQYGVNFVVDASVDRVPVTINVTEVPWNFALDSVLKANRLGIEVNGNILRIATLRVLKDEASLRAEEERARAELRAAQLENTPLVTEFIRLNYARASGTLAGAHGGAGGFAGGTTGINFNVGGDASGSGGERGILPIIARRLSRRGGVEVDGRSNTLIVTDVKENVDAIRRLVQLLDQPEPQVEIETRIVLASRTFSRDLGVQLSALVLSSDGAAGSFATGPASPAAPGQPANTIGFRPGGNPQTVLNPTVGLGANNPTTVIGLTTGIFGSAQISALITAAESKGQAKIVATPRVTALNNRPAQIESGTQIPVVTPQSGGSGSTIFTTTFVSVPLRLSITPQITDAGTIILRVVMENNTVNTTVNSLGTPGIDTQRMQTEVLVPDGGTTVVGGVLNDREGESQNRTPGLGSLPVIGNLFKRKNVFRNTDEILFFITPRIYRPDYQGRRVESTPVTGTRSVQIPQPVPLGNPGTNTPVPNPQGQEQPVQPVEGQTPPVSPSSDAGVRP